MINENIDSIEKRNANQAFLEPTTANKVEAKKILRNLQRRVQVAFALGFMLSVTLEFIRFRYLENKVDAWTLRGIFIPLASLVWLFAMFSSVSMQSTLKARGVANPLSPSNDCVAGYLAKNDAEGLRLIRGVAVAGSTYTFVLGMAIGTCIYMTFQN